MTPEAELHQLAVAGDRISELAATVDLRTPVHTCGDWTLEDLIAHCARIWTMVAASLRAGSAIARNSAEIERPAGILSDWHAHAITDLHHLLSELGSDTPGWTINPRDNTSKFWIRRMSQEAAMHRWDAENALGDPTPIDAELAVAGVNELLEHFIGDRKPQCFAGNGETLHFHSTDAHGEWVITRTADGIDVELAHGKGDVAARGPASDLLLFVWGRKLPEDLEVFGESALLDEWQEKVRF